VKPRKAPCASCPYRRDCPSGLWAAEEYDKLPGYDGTTGEQAERGAYGVFACHQNPGQVCAGWAAVHGDRECLALRMAGGLDPEVDVPAVLAYSTGVPLWPSGAAAAVHGKRDLAEPGEGARAAVQKIVRVRARAGSPVVWGEASVDNG
jgi:hypothetical protein